MWRHYTPRRRWRPPPAARARVRACIRSTRPQPRERAVRVRKLVRRCAHACGGGVANANGPSISRAGARAAVPLIRALRACAPSAPSHRAARACVRPKPGRRPRASNSATGPPGAAVQPGRAGRAVPWGHDGVNACPRPRRSGPRGRASCRRPIFPQNYRFFLKLTLRKFRLLE